MKPLLFVVTCSLLSLLVFFLPSFLENTLARPHFARPSQNWLLFNEGLACLAGVFTEFRIVDGE